MGYDVQRYYINLVLNHGPSWDHDLVARVGHHDDGVLERGICERRHVARHCEIVKFEDVGNAAETLKVQIGLLEVGDELRDGRGAELTKRVHHE